MGLSILDIIQSYNTGLENISMTFLPENSLRIVFAYFKIFVCENSSSFVWIKNSYRKVRILVNSREVLRILAVMMCARPLLYNLNSSSICPN